MFGKRGNVRFVKTETIKATPVGNFENAFGRRGSQVDDQPKVDYEPISRQTSRSRVRRTTAVPLTL